MPIHALRHLRFIARTKAPTPRSLHFARSLIAHAEAAMPFFAHAEMSRPHAGAPKGRPTVVVRMLAPAVHSTLISPERPAVISHQSPAVGLVVAKSAALITLLIAMSPMTTTGSCKTAMPSFVPESLPAIRWVMMAAPMRFLPMTARLAAMMKPSAVARRTALHFFATHTGKHGTLRASFAAVVLSCKLLAAFPHLAAPLLGEAATAKNAIGGISFTTTLVLFFLTRLTASVKMMMLRPIAGGLIGVTAIGLRRLICPNPARRQCEKTQ